MNRAGEGAGPTESDRPSFPPPLAERALFVERHARLVYAALQRVLGPSGLAAGPGRSDVVEDLFAQTFVAMFEDDARRLRQWDGRCSQATWISLVARSVAQDWVRAERRRERRLDRGADPLEVSHAFETTDDRKDIADDVLRLRAALATLPEADRALITALVMEDRPASAVAAELGLAPGAVYTRKSRALDKLRIAFDQIGKETGPAASGRGMARQRGAP